MVFRLAAPFPPTGDQPQAIEALCRGVEHRLRFQTLLGVTGSGKTFTMANVIARAKKPALILSHNKTLAAQLYEELKRFFPDNAVHYFVSYYDYYQPEAYIPQTDTYIEKDVKVNEELDRLRHAATQAVLTRNDVIVVASVSAIYNIGSPDDYLSLSLAIAKGQKITQRELLERLTDLQYTRNDAAPDKGTYRVRVETITVVSPTATTTISIDIRGGRITGLRSRGAGLNDPEQPIAFARIFPAKFWVTPPNHIPLALANIEAELAERLSELKRAGRLLEAQRLEQRTREDLTMIRQTGYCHGIENYSRHLEFREPGSPPYTLIDYFNAAYGSTRNRAELPRFAQEPEATPRRNESGNQSGWLLFVDESHQTIPQLRGMASSDRSRKDVLIHHGFRLPSARDNRPLTFREFLEKTGQTIFASATPGPYEARVSQRVEVRDSRVAVVSGCVEQLIRPTGLLDPTIEIRPTKNQLPVLVREIERRVAKEQRTLVTTLTKRLAEALTQWLQERGIRVEYLHADIDTLDRPEILHRLRSGEIDVVVGINLLREGLDLPEVSLVAILDADQEGFLRNETTLIQTMGRAARHIDGHVILFADTMTGSMRAAVAETERRRRIQERWNREHGITPTTIVKPMERSTLIGRHEEDTMRSGPANPQLLRELRRAMELAVKNLEFEKAAKIRDMIASVTRKHTEERKER